jgi:D-alanine-D-alanine ligase
LDESKIENRKSKMTNKIRVGIIFGGKSGEHEVSLASAQSVARAIDRTKYDVVLIGVTKDGRWLAGDQVLDQLIAASPSLLLKSGQAVNDDAMPLNGKSLVPTNANSSPLGAIDVAFPLIHGPMGEDGTVQGLLELVDVPYVGANVAASAVGMDKALMKAIFHADDLPMLDWMVVLRREWEIHPEDTIRRVEAEFGYPCFIKPANLGSSVGVSKAHNWDELTQALTTAAQYDRKIIAERAAMDAREIECGVLGNDDPIASVPGEIAPHREFYDYTAKYDDTAGTNLIVPADLPPDVARAIQGLAVRAFKAIDASGMARVDFFVERATNKVYLNEINTIPGFTAVSMYPRMWEKSGLSYSDLIDRLIQLALERHEDKKRSKITFESK